MKRNDPRHGTYTGWQQHQKEGRKPCEPCRVARNDYMREFRKANPEDARRSKCRSRALWALAARHPAEFHELFVLEVTRDNRERAS